MHAFVYENQNSVPNTGSIYIREGVEASEPRFSAPTISTKPTTSATNRTSDTHLKFLRISILSIGGAKGQTSQ
jgi:hypothetical protein